MTEAVDINVTSYRKIRQRPVPPSGVAGAWFDSTDVIDTRTIKKRGPSINSSQVNGWRPPLPWNHHGCQTKSSGGAFISIRTGAIPSGWDYDRVQCDATSIPIRTSVAHDSNLNNRAVTRALLKVKDQKFHAGIFIAEGRRNVRLVRDTASSIATNIRSFKRGLGTAFWRDLISHATPRRALESSNRATRSAAQKWLAVQYGWRPLLADISNGLDACAELFEESTPTIAVHARAKEVNSSILKTTTAVTSGCGWDIKRTTVHQAHCRLDFVLNLPELATASQLGLLNPFEIVWELVPFSFIVDWFVPVSQWLGTLDAGFGWTFKGGSVSQISRAEDFGAKRYISHSSVKAFKGNPLMLKAFRFTRSVFTSTPVPAPYYRDPFSVERALNAIALLRVLFR